MPIDRLPLPVQVHSLPVIRARVLLFVHPDNVYSIIPCHILRHLCCHGVYRLSVSELVRDIGESLLAAENCGKPIQCLNHWTMEQNLQGRSFQEE